MSMNCWNGMGRLVKDPELQTTPSGVSVTTFAIAVERDYVDKDTNERGVDFIDVLAWRGMAEFVCKYFSKGKMIGVVGRIQNRTYTDKEGVQRRKTEIIADKCYFGGDSGKKASEEFPSDEPTSGFEKLSDDIPF